jgi:hypothetical protein
VSGRQANPKERFHERVANAIVELPRFR